MWKNEHVTKMEQTNSDMSNKFTMLDSKVDQHSKDTTEAVSKAKEEAIAASQQGDADTINAADQKAKEGDAQLRADLTKTIDMQGKEAMDAVKGIDAKMQEQNMAHEKSDKAQDAAIKQLQSDMMALKKDVLMVDMKASEKPMLVTTVNFGSGQTALSSKAKEMLDGVVDQLMASDAKIVVVGHADGTPVLRGSHRSNWDLSQSRANSAAKYLKSKGIDAARIEAVGMAHTKPIAPQNTAAGRAMNRRVEVILLPAGAMM
jgi:outer membrane protein OmpA-like peptidoglycan-associated protein